MTICTKLSKDQVKKNTVGSFSYSGDKSLVMSLVIVIVIVIVS